MKVDEISGGSVVNQGTNITNYFGLQIDDVTPLLRDMVKQEVTNFNQLDAQIVRDEASIDQLIEKVQEGNVTSAQLLTNEAQRILPLLPNEAIAVLVLMSYCKMVVYRTKAIFEEFIKSMNPILNVLPQVSNIDINYLAHINCISPIFCGTEKMDLIEKSRNEYPLAFIHPIDCERSKQFIMKYKIREANKSLLEALNNNPNESEHNYLSQYQFFGVNNDGTISPMFLKKESYIDEMKRNGYERMIEDFENLLDSAIKMSDQEIISYYEKFNSNWSLAIRMLKDNPLPKYHLNTLGLLIGARKLFQLSGMSLPTERLLMV